MVDCLLLPLFELSACGEIMTALRSAGGKAATVYGSQATAAVEPTIRKAERIIAPPAIRDRLVRQLVGQRGLIEAHFGQSLGDLEEPQFLRYAAGDYFIPHQDGNTPLLRDDSRFRKISVVVFLNAQSERPQPTTYGGGSLVLHGSFPDLNVRQPVPALPGTLAAFRSETTHEVTPLTRGERYTVIAWYRAG